MRNWKILRAAVEQEILFPNRSTYEAYIDKLETKEFPFGVLSERDQEDGSLIVLMRKRYNPQNEFLPDSERAPSKKSAREPMTFREKAKKDHPSMVYEEAVGGVSGCPSDYGYEPPSCSPCHNGSFYSNEQCKRCWDRKIPESL